MIKYYTKYVDSADLNTYVSVEHRVSQALADEMSLWIQSLGVLTSILWWRWRAEVVFKNLDLSSFFPGMKVGINDNTNEKFQNIFIVSSQIRPEVQISTCYRNWYTNSLFIYLWTPPTQWGVEHPNLANKPQKILINIRHMMSSCCLPPT